MGGCRRAEEDSMETALQKAEFEKRFLALVYQTDVVITAPRRAIAR